MLFVQILINGVLLGGLYACMAIGFSVVWGVMNLINLAHGSLIVIGAYVTYVIATGTGIDPFLTLPASALVLFVIGFLLQKYLLNRVVRTSVMLTLVLTFGLDMVLVNMNIALFTADLAGVTPSYAHQGFEFGGVKVPYTRLGVFGVALTLTLLLSVFMSRTRTGQAIRATAQNPRAAHVLGIDTGRIYAITFGIGALMAGVAGSLTAVIQSFSPVVGASYTLKSFVIVVLGGLGSIPGAIVAGIVLGVTENLVIGLWDPGYSNAISFLLLVIVLVLRPGGLLGDAALAQSK